MRLFCAILIRNIFPPILPLMVKITPSMGRVFGKVSDSAGAPIAGASVYVVEAREGVGGFGRRFFGRDGSDKKAITDAEGKYEIKNVPVPVVGITCTSDNYVEKEINPASQGPDIEVNFILTEGLVMKGTVVDKDGNPLDRVAVTSEGKSAITNEEGQFELRVSDQEFSMRLLKRGFRITEKTFAAGTSEATIVLRSPAKMIGKIVSVAIWPAWKEPAIIAVCILWFLFLGIILAFIAEYIRDNK